MKKVCFLANKMVVFSITRRLWDEKKTYHYKLFASFDASQQLFYGVSKILAL